MVELSNEELAVRIQRGEREHEAQLWAHVVRVIATLARGYRPLLERYNHVDMGDLIQCGYFAMVEAAKEFKPKKGFRFSSFLRISYKKQISILLGAKLRTVEGKKKRVYPDEQTSLNLMINSEGSEDEFIDTLEDKAGEQGFLDIEDRELARIMDEAISKLDHRQQAVIRGLYYDKDSTRTIMKKLNMKDIDQVHNVRIIALTRLSRNKLLQEIYYGHYSNTSAPKPIDPYKAGLESVVIAEENQEDWLGRIRKQLEGIKNGFR